MLQQPHNDFAILLPFADAELAWLAEVLSPSAPCLRAVASTQHRHDDSLLRTIETDLPRLSFRCQVLLARAAAKHARNIETVGHA